MCDSGPCKMDEKSQGLGPISFLPKEEAIPCAMIFSPDLGGISSAMWDATTTQVLKHWDLKTVGRGPEIAERGMAELRGPTWVAISAQTGLEVPSGRQQEWKPSSRYQQKYGHEQQRGQN